MKIVEISCLPSLACLSIILNQIRLCSEFICKVTYLAFLHRMCFFYLMGIGFKKSIYVFVVNFFEIKHHEIKVTLFVDLGS